MNRFLQLGAIGALAAIGGCAAVSEAPYFAETDARLELIEGGAVFALDEATPDEPSESLADTFFQGVLTARFGPTGTDQSGLQDLLETETALPIGWQNYGWRELCDRLQFDMDYAGAARACSNAAALEETPDRELEDAALFARVASAAQPTRSVGASGTATPLSRDLANLLRATITSGVTDARHPMIIDTGAETNVVPQSVADEFGMRMLEGEVRVNTPTEPVVGHMAVAERIEIGEMAFENVIFLVLPDDQLTFADGAFFIDGIIGLPVFSTAGRMAWDDNGTTLQLGAAAPSLGEQETPLYWHTDGVGFYVSAEDGTPGTAFFDSGASSTQIGTAIIPHLTAMERDALTDVRTETGTAAGTSVVDYQQAALIRLNVAGTLRNFTDVLIVEDDAFGVSADFAKLGSDNIHVAEEFVLDFEAMRYRIRWAD